MGAKRSWTVEQKDYDTVEDFRNAVVQDLVGIEWAGHRLGRAFTVAPIRTKVGERVNGEPVYDCVGWYIKEEFVPAARPVDTVEDDPGLFAPTVDEAEADLIDMHTPDGEPVEEPEPLPAA